MTDSVLVQAPAKVNLRLVILAREETGYHQLETVFCGIDLHDRLEIARGGKGVRLEVSGGIDTGDPDRNLVVRAAHAFRDAAGIDDGFEITLEKKIPSAAGLGGGSSDAAATLRGLNCLCGGPLDPWELLRIGAGLGSDVPFFLSPTPLALAWGRGERLLALDPLPPRPVLVVHPGIPLPTPWAFQRLAEIRERGGGTTEPVTLVPEALTDWSRIRSLAVNDLETPAFEKLPELRTLVDKLLKADADVALLAGSGASVFAIFQSESARAEGQRIADSMGFKTWLSNTLSGWPDPVSQR